MYKAEEYTYRVFWSEEDQEFVGTVAEFPYVSFLDPDRTKAFEGVTKAVSDILEVYAEDGEEAITPLGKRAYSGKFALRMSKEQHRRIAMEAAEQGVSINQLLVSRV